MDKALRSSTLVSSGFSVKTFPLLLIRVLGRKIKAFFHPHNHH